GPCIVWTRRRPRPPLFPYTTLFRSGGEEEALLGAAARAEEHVERAVDVAHARGRQPFVPFDGERQVALGRVRRGVRRAHEHELRSEEHTSELQSREKLVCRLLLEKK